MMQLAFDARRRSSSRLDEWERLTAANESSSSPSARSSSEWQTPGADSFRSRGGNRRDEMGLDQEVRSWPDEQWATPRARERGTYQREHGDPETEHLTLSGQAELWATPQSGDATRGLDLDEARADRGAGMPNLATQSAQWATPNATDGKDRRTSTQGATLARDAEFWPTPDAQVMNDGQTLAAREERRERELAKGYNGNGGGETLGGAVQLWPTPQAGDERATGAEGQQNQRMLTHDAERWPNGRPGPATTPDGLLSLLPPDWSSLRRRLNPKFVEWLMGWPEDSTSLGLTDCASSETGSSPSRPRSRSASSPGTSG